MSPKFLKNMRHKRSLDYQFFEAQKFEEFFRSNFDCNFLLYKKTNPHLDIILPGKFILQYKKGFSQKLNAQI